MGNQTQTRNNPARSIRFSPALSPAGTFSLFNGNTFADVGRATTAALLADLPPIRLRQATSAAAHYIAGVLDRDSMIQIIGRICVSADLIPGVSVRTLRGSTHGIVTRVLDDGRVVWRTSAGVELTAVPEALEPDE